MRPILVLVTLCLALLLGSPAQAQSLPPEPAPIPDGFALHVAQPRSAVLSLYESAAESFLLPGDSSLDSPIRLLAPAARLRLHADYEALFLPLTAGWSRFHLAAYRADDAGRTLLAEDDAALVDFGPARHRGRLVLDLALRPGLHHLTLVATTEARAVGVNAWTRDEDQREIWVLVPGLVGQAGASLSGAVANAGALGGDQSATDPNLPLGGLAAGSQRGVLAARLGGAVNFEAAAGATLVARVGQAISVWSDYELWWAAEAKGDAGASLSLLSRGVDGNVVGAALASDRFALADVAGPRLAVGRLHLARAFDRAGTYSLVAVLETQVRVGDQVFVDRDAVPFTLKVLGDPPLTGNIVGRVTGGAGLALEGVVIEAQDANGVTVGRARSNAAGAYRIDDLAPGSYLVHALPGDLNFLEQWFEGKASPRGADPVTVERGSTTSDIDFDLIAGGSITGRVTDAEGRPLAGIDIAAGLLASGARPGTPTDPGLVAGLLPGHRTRTNAEGYYSLQPLAAGRWWLRASDPQGKYLTEFWDDKPSLDQADPIGVVAGKLRADMDFSLASGGAITGQVREQSDLTVILPLAGMRVEVFGNDDLQRPIAVTDSGPDGRYQLGGLREGRYLVRASDPSGKHQAEWYREAGSPADAEPVPVAADRRTEGIDFTLEPTPARTRVFVDPPQSGLSQGASGRVAVAVEAVANLGAFEVELRWDPAILRVDAVELGDFLGSSGRQVIPVEPEIDNSQGRLRFAAASLGREAGPSGAGALFAIGFTGLALGETRLALGETLLTTPAAEAIPHGRADGSVKVGACLFGDFDCNCRIDIRDVMAVVARWGTRVGDPDYDPTFDLDADGDIDIIDVQIEAGLWGKTCASDPAGSRPLGATSGVRDQDDRSTPTGSGFAAAPAAPAGASLRLEAAPAAPRVGDPVEIALIIDEAADLAGFEASLDFDPAMLRFVGGQLDDFLGSSGRTVLPLGPLETEGRVTIGGGTLPGKPAPSGSGRLATLRFEVLAAGSSPVRVAEGITVDGEQRSSVVAGTGVTVRAEPTGATERAFVPMVLTR
ncbi:MAG: carboxypeptidase regulatory-like domain-containing protein [Caldilineae bacterium]|nr:carboxypeptidase regulatory-like domain-containing protein [Chloroflexota bacterium]MCB9177354.1 carboxypeptidase regulatory-like domain-containing protein [Caldilineae bacterium]